MADVILLRDKRKITVERTVYNNVGRKRKIRTHIFMAPGGLRVQDGRICTLYCNRPDSELQKIAKRAIIFAVNGEKIRYLEQVDGKRVPYPAKKKKKEADDG